MAHASVDRSKPVPLYHQLKELLQERIELAEWPPGTRIPTEKQLAAAYGVSQITVRQALARLASEGLVQRFQGRGTFVAQPSVAQDVLRLAGFSDSYAQAGATVETRLVEAGVVEATEGVRRRLKLAAGESVVRIARLRLNQGVPVSLQTSYLPQDLGRELLGRDLERESLFRLLTEVFGVVPARAEEVISAVAVDDYESGILLVSPGAPALLLQRTTYDQRGRPVEFVKSVLRGDKCKFTLTLNAELPAGEPTGGPLDGQRVGLQTRVS